MNRMLHLTIATPAKILVDVHDVVALRAEDETGSFGILPGHADFLTVLVPTVIRWRTHSATGETRERYCAIKEGVLRVSGGSTVSIACRDGVPGDSLAELEARVHAARVEELEATRRARVEATQLHAQAVRQLLRYLRVRPGASATGGAIDGKLGP
jgi:F-type H+-transporting ATPase subunit epsilon